MAKNKGIRFVCQQCGAQYGKWVGRCRDCGEWNAVTEERVAAARPRTRVLSDSTPPQPIAELRSQEFNRRPSELSELDRVLGGGLVPGSVVLIGGEPGVGKSTLLLQAADQYARQGDKVLYVSGEESTSQIALRAERLGVETANLLVAAETELERILTHVEEFSPDLLILDSVQTLQSEALDSQAGSVGQLRECTNRVIGEAKRRQMATFLVGHVTKEGSIAGPKVLEHMVDVVLYFEGTANQTFRLLRTIKNRFGSTNEIGVFEITNEGARQVHNPSELFLSERPERIPGSVIAASLEGTRPILVEIQALASATSLNYPRRTAIGLDPNRISLLVAILEKRGGFRLFDQDVYVNVAGGLRLNEPATDLAVIGALISSYSGKAVETGTVFFGEVGLGGEIRSVPRATERLREAARIGLKRAYVPARLKQEVEGLDMELLPVRHIQELADRF